MALAKDNVTQIFPCTNDAIFCETFNCTTPAEYHVGRPDGPRNLWRNLCGGCVISIAANLPKELLKHVPGMERCSCKDDTICGICAERKGYFICPECLKSFKNISGLKGHVYMTHKKEV